MVMRYISGRQPEVGSLRSCCLRHSQAVLPYEVAHRFSIRASISNGIQMFYSEMIRIVSLSMTAMNAQWEPNSIVSRQKRSSELFSLLWDKNTSHLNTLLFKHP